ncbi:MAG: glycosyltransferase family 4 protein [Pyrinomonadaceae bacterium]|nr:glycosyltransferase family 4 protein [Pyrinomonadaceae bacterium]
MKVLAIVPSIYETSPGQRFRIEQWEPLLAARGVEISYAPFENDELHALLYRPGHLRQKLNLVARAFLRRIVELRRIKNYDVVYVFREAALLGPAFFEHWIHRSGVPMVFDFDDAVFVSYRSPTNGYLSYLKMASKTKAICRMASHVMAGNPYLAEYAGRVNDRVTIVPTTIDTEKYAVSRRRSEATVPTIGWTGSFSTVQHLDTLRPALEKLARRVPFRLRVIGTPSYQLEGARVEAMPWRSASELEDLNAIDIGIMPLPDDAWSKGKCGLKALQFMALGIPTVCSPVGVNTEIIQDGQNGFIAGSEDEWIEKLSLLLRSSELRERIGTAGRATVEAKYSANVQAPRVHELLQSVVRDAQRERKNADGKADGNHSGLFVKAISEEKDS